jgi:hypothetical protein
MTLLKKESGVTGNLPRRFRLSFPENPLDIIFFRSHKSKYRFRAH